MLRTETGSAFSRDFTTGRRGNPYFRTRRARSGEQITTGGVSFHSVRRLLALEEQGADVTLVAGPSSQPTPPGVARIDVESALGMHAAVMQRARDCDLFVAAAAVADYRPETAAGSKIKKSAETLDIRLVKNPDILAEVAALDDGPFTVGFAAETDDVAAYADNKRRRKGLDMIAANHVGGERGGFDSDENALLVLWEGGQEAFPMTGKLRLARQLVDLISRRIHA